MRNISGEICAFSILLNSSTLQLLERINSLQQPQLFVSMAGFTDIAANSVLMLKKTYETIEARKKIVGDQKTNKTMYPFEHKAICVKALKSAKTVEAKDLIDAVKLRSISGLDRTFGMPKYFKDFLLIQNYETDNQIYKAHFCLFCELTNCMQYANTFKYIHPENRFL